MRVLLAAPLLLLASCARPEDPLVGRWDVADPETAAKGSVTVATFGNRLASFERRGEVLGIGRVTVIASGEYELSGSEVSLRNTDVKVDASAIADPKLRAETVRILEGAAKKAEGEVKTYTLKVESPDRIRLERAVGTLTLTRAR